MKAKISLRNATFSYGDGDVFSGLNLEVSQGEIFCLLGANGCGKTTLLRCLHGALRLKEGNVCLDGRDISSMGATEVARKVGFVFQEHNAPFPYPVLEVVRLGRAPHLGLFSSPSQRDSEIAEQMLETVGISHLRDKRYTQISGGERQLVLIARTLAQEPEVILLDEPTSHLDFKNQTLILRMINKLARQGLTIILSSHFPNHAFLFTSRVAMMNGGKFIATGKPEEVMTEENLRETYGMDVKVLSVNDPVNGDAIKFCIPTKEYADVIASGLAGIENAFEGESRIEGETARIDIGARTDIEATSRKEGKVRLYIPSDEIIISRQQTKSSGRNVLKGQIDRISDQGTGIKLEVDAGRKFTILITRKSCLELELKPGLEVYLTFKASAVHVI